MWVPSPFVMNNPHSGSHGGGGGGGGHSRPVGNSPLTADHEYHPLVFYLPERKQLSCYTCCKEKKVSQVTAQRPWWEATTTPRPTVRPTWVVTYSTFPPDHNRPTTTPRPWGATATTATQRPWWEAPDTTESNPSTWVVTYSTFPPDHGQRPTRTTTRRPWTTTRRPWTTTRRPWTTTTTRRPRPERPWLRPTTFAPLDINEIEIIDARFKDRWREKWRRAQGQKKAVDGSGTSQRLPANLFSMKRRASKRAVTGN